MDAITAAIPTTIHRKPCNAANESSWSTPSPLVTRRHRDRSSSAVGRSMTSRRSAARPPMRPARSVQPLRPNDATCATSIFTSASTVSGNGSYPRAASLRRQSERHAGRHYSGDLNNNRPPTPATRRTSRSWSPSQPTITTQASGRSSSAAAHERRRNAQRRDRQRDRRSRSTSTVRMTRPSRLDLSSTSTVGQRELHLGQLHAYDRGHVPLDRQLRGDVNNNATAKPATPPTSLPS